MPLHIHGKGVRQLSLHLCGRRTFRIQVAGFSLDAIMPELAPTDQDQIAAKFARWSTKLSKFRFPLIGSLYPGKEDNHIIGPVVRKRFFSEGRGQFTKLERGPFKSVKEYLLACTQREIECSKNLSAQDASLSYQRDVEECRLQVEQSMSVMENLIHKCPGLDDEDEELAPFCLDIHDLNLKDVTVSKENPTRIVSTVSSYRSGVSKRLKSF